MQISVALTQPLGALRAEPEVQLRALPWAIYLKILKKIAGGVA
ncbi:hypothetical protein T03_6907 [Trichinella britovi]|uniref:Uncharacterized protein n=1 Tax=Trichinella britovi TaxID=45882 RepID=A0A0V1C4N1_TRIBR|nr:hypothetical protein T03_6907 [Trichinella britovi]